MEEEKLKLGDVVVLKSGGPAMTIEFLTAAGASCVWFVCGQLQKASFVNEALTKYTGNNELL